jgi:GT2 family glycosyltransferase
MNDVSVIIVTWNNENEIESCIESVENELERQNALTGEIIVIDNNSSDKTTYILQKISRSNLNIRQNNENAGFTKAVNQGIKLASRKYIFLLNPDTYLKPGCIEILCDFLDNNKNYGACSPVLINDNGTIQHSIRNFPNYWTMLCEFTLLAYLFPKTKLLGRWKMKYFDYTNDSDVSQPMAAALMIKKNVIDEIGIMDERFFMFFNDVDLCKRIVNNNYKIRYLKSAEAVHKKGASVYKDRINMIKTWNRDCIKYFEKHHKQIILLWWLKINLKISEILRILYYRAFK